MFCTAASFSVWFLASHFSLARRNSSFCLMRALCWSPRLSLANSLPRPMYAPVRQQTVSATHPYFTDCIVFMWIKKRRTAAWFGEMTKTRTPTSNCPRKSRIGPPADPEPKPLPYIFLIEHHRRLKTHDTTNDQRRRPSHQPLYTCAETFPQTYTSTTPPPHTHRTHW
jgi:hypothetical protein